MKDGGSVLHNFFLYAGSEDRKKLLKSLKDTRNYIRNKHDSRRIEQFRNSGGLEILVKLLRRTVCGSTTKQHPTPRPDGNVSCSKHSRPTNTIRPSGTGGSSTTGTRPSSSRPSINITINTTESETTVKFKPHTSRSKSNPSKVKAVQNVGSKRIDPVDEQYDKNKNADSGNAVRLDILNMCVSILATCCTELDSKQKVKDAGCVTILGRILKHENDEGVINRTARAIANLAKLPELSACFHKQEFIPCLVQHLLNSEDSNTRYSLVRAFKLLADTSEHLLAIIYNGGIRALLKSLTDTDQNLVAISIETVAEMTHPYNFNHLKKPSWRILWETVGNQAAEAIDVLLRLRETTKPSVADQAFALLNNLMNSKAVRLAVGKCDKIGDFVQLCSSGEVATHLPYLQCLAMCCKESVNRVKVKHSNGLDVLLNVLRSSMVLHEKHIALAGLVHYYHDDIALRYLCVNGMIEYLTNYLSTYIERDLKVPLTHFVKPNYNVEVSLRTSKASTGGKDSSPDSYATTETSMPEKTADDVVPATVEVFPHPGSESEQTLLTPTNTPQKDGGGILCQFESSCTTSAEGDLSTSSPVYPEDNTNLYDEYSVGLDQSPPPPYSPPSVDWSNVFALREQQGYRGLSPQSNLSSRSNSMEREIPKYQYSSERSVSPNSDVSWTMAEQTTEEFLYSPVVSDEEESSENVDESSGCVSEEQITAKEVTLASMVDPTSCNSNHPSTSIKLNIATVSPSLSIQSPSKRSRSPSVDSSYESDVMEDLPLVDDDACKPEGYALHLLYKCSFMDDTLENLATFNVIDVLLKLALYSTQFKSKSTRILNSVLSSRLVFEQLLLLGIPHYVNTSWTKFLSEIDSNDRTVKESELIGNVSQVTTSIDQKKERWTDTSRKRKRRVWPSEDGGGGLHSCSLLQELADVAESRYGRGVLNYLFSSLEISRKLAAFDALSILCRSPTSLTFHLVECKSLQQLLVILQSHVTSSAGGAAILVRSLQRFSQTAKVQLQRGNDLDSNYQYDEQQETSNTVSNQIKPNIYCKKQSSSDPQNVRLMLDDGSFVVANRRMLGQSSSYFKCMLQGSYKESKENIIQISDVSNMALEIIIHHLYGCQWQRCAVFNGVSLQIGMESLATAGRLFLPDLQESVTKYCLQGQINSENVSNVGLFSISHGCRSLWRYCLKFMLVNDSVKVDRFLDLSTSLFGEESFHEIQSIVKDAISKLSRD